MTQTMTPPQIQAQPTYEITDADKKRMQTIADAWRAYKGELDKPLKPMPGEPDDNVLSNRCKAVVRMGVGFLFGKELEISVEEGAPQEAQDFLNDVWGRKEQRIPLLQKLAMNGAIAGSAFLRIVPDDDGDFRLVVVDPAIVSMQTAPQDCETVLCYCLQYSQSEQINGQPKTVWYREEIMRVDPDGNASRGQPDDDDTWQIQHWTQVGNPGMQPKKDGWIAAGDPIVWDYPFAPIFHCQNMVVPNDAWGEPDIAPDLIGMNEALNLNQSDTNRVLKLYAGPFIWGKGMGDNQTISREPGRITILPSNPDAKLDAVQITSDLQHALEFADDLRSDMDELTRVPGIATGRMKDMPRGQVSGVALRLMFMALMMKTEEKRCLYGELIIDVCQALLVLNNMSGDIGISLPWVDPLPEDDLQSLQAAILKKQVGISNSTIQREMGYDPDEEMELSQTEDAQKLVNFARGQGMPPTPPQQPGQPEQGPQFI